MGRAAVRTRQTGHINDAWREAGFVSLHLHKHRLSLHLHGQNQEEPAEGRTCAGQMILMFGKTQGAATITLAHHGNDLSATARAMLCEFDKFQTVCSAVNPLHSGPWVQGRHRDLVIVVGPGPRCQVLRFIPAWCHKRLRRDQETCLTEPPGIVSLRSPEEPRLYYPR